MVNGMWLLEVGCDGLEDAKMAKSNCCCTVKDRKWNTAMLEQVVWTKWHSGQDEEDDDFGGFRF